MPLKIKPILLSMVIFPASTMQAQVDIRAHERENPAPIELNGLSDVIPEFINIAADTISLNGADWSHVRQSLTSGRLNIVHIGDSHVQADFMTSEARHLFQANNGNAGRGLIVPLKMAGTNQPTDYSFSATGHWMTSTLLKQDTGGGMTPGFTGVAVSPLNPTSEIITMKTRDNDDAFDLITLFHSAPIIVDSVMVGGKRIDVAVMPSTTDTHIMLPYQVNQIDLCLTFETAPTAIHGASLECSWTKGGVVYHSYGINGATYHNYNSLPDSLLLPTILAPDLIIVSLGTNEAYGNLSSGEIRTEIDRLVTTLHARHPRAAILLTTPMESQIRQKKTIYSRRRKRRRPTTVTTYAVNSKVAQVANVIADYCRDNNIALFDWYNVAGGHGASSRWQTSGLTSSDGVHHTQKGYSLQGQLLHNAINNQLK